MRNRRFVLLSAILVALNLGLWIVPQGIAMRQVLVSSLFGKSLIRADVVINRGCSISCQEWRVDRGIVVSNALGVLTLREADTKVQAIAVSSATKVTGTLRPIGINAVKPGWRVLVTWPAPSGPADSVVVEKK